MDCVNFKRNKEICTCTYTPCSRKGSCCDCIAYHKEAGEIPGCLFPEAAEKTYDRSIHNFVRAYQ